MLFGKLGRMVAIEIQPVCIKNSFIDFPRKVIGNGSFGVVYQAKLCETGEMVAIKKVLQDKRFKNRELQVISQSSFYCQFAVATMIQ